MTSLTEVWKIYPKSIEMKSPEPSKIELSPERGCKNHSNRSYRKSIQNCSKSRATSVTTSRNIDVCKPSKKVSKNRQQQVSKMWQKGTPKWPQRPVNEPRFGSLLLVRAALGFQTALRLRPDPTWIPFWLYFWYLFDDFLPMCVSFVRKIYGAGTL